MNEELTLLINIKENIKESIINKGITPSNGLIEYGNYIRNIGNNTPLRTATRFAYSTWQEVPNYLLSNIYCGKDVCAYMFYHCENLIKVPLLDLSESTSVYRMFYNCYSLVNLDGLKGLKVSLDLRWSRSITAESIENIVDNIDPVTETQTITLYSTLDDVVSDEVKAKATSKGWNIKFTSV